MISTPRLTVKERLQKRQLEHEINLELERRATQRERLLLEAFAKDPELKYFIGVGAGAGVAWIGLMLEGGKGNTAAYRHDQGIVSCKRCGGAGTLTVPEMKLIGSMKIPQPTGQSKTITCPECMGAKEIDTRKGLPPFMPWDAMLYASPANIKTATTQAYIDKGLLPASLPNPLDALNPWGFMGNLLVIGGGGFAGFCSLVLILKAMFGEQGMAEVLKGIGEIVPG